MLVLFQKFGVVAILKIGCYWCFKKWCCCFNIFVVFVLIGAKLWLLFLFNFVQNFW